MILRKKLIEVALPLDAINKASAREKSIRHGHPSTLHLWWARRPLAAARAVIFSQMVDDPSEHTETLLSDPSKKRAANRELKKRREAWNERKAKHDEASGQMDQSVPVPGPEPTLQECVADIERERLFEIIRQLVLWENTTDEKVLQQARDEIWQSWRYTCAENADHPRAKELFDRHKLPAFHDPFAGGGSLPLEAQRLGLETYATDLNPVAVLINKAMIEIPPKFAGKPPVNPDAQQQKVQMGKSWRGAQGLAEDVRYYGQWMRDEAEKRIGYLYPKVEVTSEMSKGRTDLKALVGQKLTVIAWLWARTVKCPNPACSKDMPLLSSLILSAKAGRKKYLNPEVNSGSIRFTISDRPPTGFRAPEKGFKRGVSGIFECAFCGTVTTRDYVARQATDQGLGAVQTAVVAAGNRVRTYLDPSSSPIPKKIPDADTMDLDLELSPNPRDVWCRNFGLNTTKDLFNSRQLVALTTFTDLVQDARERVKRDALAAGLHEDGNALDGGGTGATAYADAVAVYLGLIVSKAADYNSTLCGWISGGETLRSTFGRQAIPMVWDYCEANILGDATGSLFSVVGQQSSALDLVPGLSGGSASQSDAQSTTARMRVVSTDPPYYDNIAYADLSDFFYVWLRRSLKLIFPGLFSTLAVPKAEELVAASYRHGSKEKSETFFLDGMTKAMQRLAEQSHPAFPVTIYYAFKQSETDSDEGTSSTGWEIFLDAVIRAGFALTGTWPMRTERIARSIGIGTNALASSIILVCRQRTADALTATRREFVAALKAELPVALAHLQRGNIAPVDLAQAAIGPGMAVYTRYAKVLDAEGNPLSVGDALALINQTLDKALAEQEGDFDPDSRWALTWFEHSGFDEGEYGVAEQLSKSKNTSVAGMVEADILESKRGKVRLLRPEELPANWDPTIDPRLTAWEIVHHLIRVLEAGGESSAAEIMAKLGSKAEVARELCYRLYTLCERKKRAAEALSYNGLVQSWPEITRLAREGSTARAEQATMFGANEE